MINYYAPQIIELGNASDLIKGECNWGGEGWAFDEIGSTAYNHLSCWGGFGFCTIVECASCNVQCANTCYPGYHMC